MEQRASRRKYHYIYKITRIKDGRYYIGMHSTDNENDGYFGSGKRITRSIRKHGKEAHTKEILEYLDSRDLLKKREREIVNEECLKDPLCMNLCLGGSGGFSEAAQLAGNTPEARAKGVATIARKRLVDPEYDAYMHKMISEKSKNTCIKRKARGEKIWSEKAVIAAQSPEARIKRTATHKQNGAQRGEKNSNYGNKWVTNEIESKCIPTNLVDEYLSNGWRFGHITNAIDEKTRIEHQNLFEQYKSVNGQFAAFVSLTGYPFTSANLYITFKKYIPDYSEYMASLPNPQKNWLTLTCLQCKISFEACQRDIRRNRKYCGSVCTGIAQSIEKQNIQLAIADKFGGLEYLYEQWNLASNQVEFKNITGYTESIRTLRNLFKTLQNYVPKNKK